MMMVDQLERYIESSVIEGTIIELGDSTKTAKQAASALGTSEENIIKSLVFLADGEPVLVIVPGPARVDEERLAEVLEADKVEMASPDQVEELTGYSVGEVPPVSLDLRKVIDESVVEKRTVYGGGGSRNHVLEIDPRYIVDEDSLVETVVE
ncbi:MAG: YbaK/EbsC family protein [Candidatus Nanohaloarchaea archaeon]|nr:YbaK/EbsC family protein [Candidatus Nanohaloarchaea archaeon]